MIHIKIQFKDAVCPIYIGEDILEKLGEMLRIYEWGQDAFVLTDNTVHKLYGLKLLDGLKTVMHKVELATVAPGEKSKSWSTAGKILTRMLESQFERQVMVVSLGGGVVGDLAGFVASIYKRGVQFVQVPTTLLAQVDASVGGKTGVNHPVGKNLIGTFYQPKLIWIDLALLKTLPRQELVCGLGEMIKYGVIYDAELFDLLENNVNSVLALDTELLRRLVKRCCKIKAEIVALDEKEHGVRMILNFGHTIGHALEAAGSYGQLSHGEAVLLGMLAESKIARDLNLLSKQAFDRIQSLVAKFDLEKKIKYLNKQTLWQAMRSDKKALQGSLRFVLPQDIGSVKIVSDVEEKLIGSGINYLLKQA
ncbi:MAG: 3-dehydroquinate synthase [bacterium]